MNQGSKKIHRTNMKETNLIKQLENTLHSNKLIRGNSSLSSSAFACRTSDRADYSRSGCTGRSILLEASHLMMEVLYTRQNAIDNRATCGASLLNQTFSVLANCMWAQCR